MFDLNDPRTVALLAAAGGLLTPVRGKGGAAFGQALSQGIQGGLLGHQGAVRTQEAVKRGESERKMEQARLDAFKRQQEDEDFKRSIAPQFFGPGNAPADGMGPVSPPKMDVAGYGAALAQRSPEMGLPFLPKPQQPRMGFAPDGTAVDMNALPVGQNFAPKQKPKFVPGDTRVIESGRTKIYQEMQPDGAWKPISKGFMDKPESDKGPSAPPGYRWSGDRLEPIPGGPQDTKVGKEADAAAARDKAAAGSAEFVISQVGKAKEQAKKGWFATGATGKLMRNVGGTDAFDLNSTVDSIKANIGFDTLAEMRRNSPTGGALGQVAVQELNMLQAARGALDTAQSEEQFLKALDGIEKHYKGWLDAVNQSKAPSGGATGAWSIQRIK